MDKIIRELEESGYSWATAYATTEEIKSGAACGQLSIVIEEN